MPCRSRWPMVLAAGVLLAGCGGSPPPVPPVLGIADARDARGIDPCVLAPADQLVELRLDRAGVAGPSAEGSSCVWSGAGGALTVTLWTDGGGLATLAANSEPTTTRVRVGGYPALETFTGRGEFCQYDLGVAQTQVVSAALDTAAPDACTALQRVLGAVVQGLPTLRS